MSSIVRPLATGRAPLAVVATAIALLALVLAGCGKRQVLFTGEVTTTSTTAANGGLAPLPADIQQSKTISVGSDLSYPPLESFQPNTQTPQGADVDIANAIGTKLGVELVFHNTRFEGLVSGLVAGQYDIVMSGMKDTATRRAARRDFVDYFQSGPVMLVRAGNPKKIQSPLDLCGRAVAVQRGTPSEDFATSLASQCATTGGTTTTTTSKSRARSSSTTTTTSKSRSATTSKTTVATGKLTVQAYPDDATAVAKLKAGASTANFTDLPLAANAVLQEPGVFEIAGEALQAQPFGIAVRQSDTQLRDALASALRAIVADGTYSQILHKWGIELGAIPSIAINTGS